MPRPRQNLPKQQRASRVVTNPVRTAEIIEEFQNKFELICRNYNWWKRIGVSTTAINQARSDLRAAVSSGAEGKLKRLHPLLELPLNLRAKEIAEARAGEASEVDVEPQDTAQAIEEEIAKPAIRGRSRDLNLAMHVEEIMALIWETCRVWPAMSKHRGKLYEPQPTNGAGRALVRLAQRMEPGITTTALAEISIRVSRQLRNRPVYFRDYHPFWDASFDPAVGEFRRGDTICGKVEIARPIFRRIPTD